MKDDKPYLTTEKSSNLFCNYVSTMPATSLNVAKNNASLMKKMRWACFLKKPGAGSVSLRCAHPPPRRVSPPPSDRRALASGGGGKGGGVKGLDNNRAKKCLSSGLTWPLSRVLAATMKRRGGLLSPLFLLFLLLLLQGEGLSQSQWTHAFFNCLKRQFIKGGGGYILYNTWFVAWGNFDITCSL